LFCGLVGISAALAAAIPAPKLDLIKQAMAAMRLDQKIQALVDQRVEAKVQAARIDNPGLNDSLAVEIREVIAGVYATKMEGPEGLLPRVYAVFDRHLTEEDLRFAVQFRGSDQGRRYREIAPRVVHESVETGRVWSERLDPEIHRRLEDRFRGTALKF
jgi:hypothetical protein